MIGCNFVFVFSLFLIVYTYIGYYAVLLLMYKLLPKKKLTHIDSDSSPDVSFLIAAYNEEKSILNKINNIFESDYPKEKISIFIVSDASTDRTNEIVKSYKDKRVHLIVSPERVGKTFCENLGIEEIKSECIVFTDASVMLDKSCLANLVKNFQFSAVGCISTCDESTRSAKNKGENLYVRYEMSVRAIEAKVDSLVGLSGSCYAARKELCTILPDYVTRDFALPLIAREKGFISIDVSGAICSVKPTEDPQKEFVRKIRTFTNGISTLVYKKNLLNIFKYGKFSFILWSHKLFRWMLPLFFVFLFLANCMLLNAHLFYKMVLFFQAAFYLLALWGSVASSEHIMVKLARIFHFLCMTNIASIVAWYNFLTGNRWATWQPTKR